MKVVIAARSEEPGCGEVRAAFPEVEFAIARTAEELVREAVNAEVIFGWPHADAIRAATKLRWVWQCRKGRRSGWTRPRDARDRP